MARTPSMTVQEAEALLGPRGSLYVTADNVATARKWLTANGVKGASAAVMARKHICAVYNDLSNKELEKIKLISIEASENEDSNEEQAAQAAPIADNDKASQIARLLAELANGGHVDEAKVKAIVESKWAELPELIAKYSPVTRIEVTRHDGSKFETSGRNHPQFPKLLRAMSARMVSGFAPNILLVGPTGSGKTHSVGHAAQALGLEFFTNGALSMDHQLMGFIDAGGQYHTTPFREAFAKPAVYLFDEIDSSDNAPLLAMAGALANSSQAFADAMVHRHKDSIIVAAANTWGHGATSDFVGRNKLDGAIRSRFPVRIAWDYDESLERDICGNVDWACTVQKARAKARQAGLKVIIDPRMSQAGAALIAQGATFQEAAEETFLADLTPEQRKIIQD